MKTIRSLHGQGFTLVEIIVTIAIIMLLAGILFPVLLSAREKARQTSCLAHQKDLAQLTILYLDDHNGRFPTGDHVWEQIQASPAQLKCPDARRLPLGYVFHQPADGASMANIPDPDRFYLTADGVNGTIVNRHAGKFLISFLDGHVTILDDLLSITRIYYTHTIVHTTVGMESSYSSTIRSIDGDGTRDAEFATQLDPHCISANASGSKIVYVAYDTTVDNDLEPPEPRQVYALNTITHKSQLISPRDANAYYSICNWDGTRILFATTTAPAGSPQPGYLTEFFEIHDGSTQSVTLPATAFPVYSPDGLHLAYCSPPAASSCAFVIQDRQTGSEQTINIPGTSSSTSDLSYNPSGALIAVDTDVYPLASPSDTCIYIYDVQNHRITPEYQQVGRAIRQVVFSPDGKYLLFDAVDSPNNGSSSEAIWSLRLSDKALHCIYTKNNTYSDSLLPFTCSL